jgi:hypothetical protein
MKFYRIRQRFPAERLTDVAAELRRELARFSVPAGRVAIAVGSRGIANLAMMVAEIARWARGHGAEPFIVPAMGSHGGATAEGQRKILEEFGITGIESSMETVALGVNAFMDRLAYESAGVIVINRVKPHTSFHGRYESGLMKMLAVGLSKATGARALHQGGVAGLREQIPVVARQVLATGKILFGVAIVENAYDETLLVRATDNIPTEEPGLLELARANLPRLPVEDLDLLIVDELGKAISGTGMDTNIIGRLRIAGEPEPAKPRIQRIFVRDVRGDSAYGIGLADVTTRRLVARANWEVTRINAETSGFPWRVQVPAVVEHDAEAVAGERIARIANTLHLERLIVSEPVLHEVAGRATIEVLGPAGLWDSLTE